MQVTELLSIAALMFGVLSFAATFVFNVRKGVFDRRPVLTFVDNGEAWEIRNIGNGPARHVIVQQKHVSGPETGTWFDPVRLPDMGRGEHYVLTWLGRVNDVGLGVTYRDMSDRVTYGTRAGEDDNVVSRLSRRSMTVRELRGLREPRDGVTPHWQAEGRT